MGTSLVYNISFEQASILFLLVINIFIRLKYESENKVNQEFRRLTLLLLFACILDVTSAITISYGSVVPRVVNLLINTAYFAMNVTVGFQFTRYVSAYVYQGKSGKGMRVNLVIFGLCFLMLAVNLFTGIIFYFDAAGSYLHGPIYFFVYAFPYYYIIYSIAVLVTNFGKFKMEQRFSVIALFALCMIGPLAQMLWFPDILLSLFTMSVGVLVCMFTLETPDYRLLMETMSELEDLRKQLQQEVELQTDRSERLSLQALRALAVTIDAKDKYTNGHSVRVAEYARELAKRGGASEQEQEEIYYVGLLHDIGKIGMPDGIINKTTKLTPEEFDVIKTHPVIGADILKNISGEIPDIEVGARWHHERYDGGGYPDGLKGEAIPKVARIISVADAYDAMTSKRSYRDVLPQEMVRREFATKSGLQFDPLYAGIMTAMIDEDPEYKMREQEA